MREVKRYDPINNDGTCGMCVEDADYGAYVGYADYAALEAECDSLKNSLLEITTRHFTESWKKRTSDAELEQYLSAGIAQLEAERDALAAENARLRGEISDLHTTMMAAAVEIQEHWAAHCDEDGYGPANLMHRLERGIASQYGYTAQTLVRLETERDTLRQQLAERDATIARLEAGIPRIQEQSHQMRQQRDKLAELLREAKSAYTTAIHWTDMRATMARIDAALLATYAEGGKV